MVHRSIIRNLKPTISSDSRSIDEDNAGKSLIGAHTLQRRGPAARPKRVGAILAEGEIGFARLTLEQPDSAGRKPRANIEAAAVGEERRKADQLAGARI
jgi:hypothetical protein